MSSFDSYNAKTTSISYPWPAEVNGIERIALSAQGDLQRVLSAFFARPIVIALVYSETTRQKSLQSPMEPVQTPTEAIIQSASPESPITQTRQVHLQCAGKIVCTATSTVRITSPDCARLFLQEKYAIGQMFRRLEKVPAFELLSVALGPVKGERQPSSSFTVSKDDSKQLWRKYTLVIPNFECEILEVFPSREMFLRGENWLTGTRADSIPELGGIVATKVDGNSPMVFKQSLSLVLAAGFLIMLIFEVSIYAGGRSRFC
ncbi:hypothetical protein JR316_0008290 [Psilocybe cubensis]|uniref:Uncharacterized protein n=2 Tax=Psilocybe cubensis TaxID=181762 RepID=A0A8H7XVE4_PSICU|nr:hypothetical protein JR316_0008290 [Psilocybe cubensis]KAH9479695.1 hypothetical protein JR316_0008290 [Psilocybe cubensis]